MNPPPPPPPPPTTTTSPFYNQHADLPTAISALNSLLQLSTSAVHSLPIPTPTPTTATTLLPCPYNCNHLVPPSSLFSHYLNCPFPVPFPLPLPHYSHTLNTTATPRPSTSSALSFSLDSYIDNNTNFFYQTCPAPVTAPIRTLPLLTVPRVLYLECADGHPEPLGFPVRYIEFLPSEIWAIRTEIQTWDGNAGGFSIRTLRAIMRLRDCKLSRFRDWVVETSPKYGVIVDFALRDHVVLLVKFCLRAVVREAFGLVGFLFSGEELSEEEILLSSESSSRRFQCLVLGEVLTWLVSQFCLMYSEVNAKAFAVDILRECILESASDASLFPVKEQEESSDLESVYRELKEQADQSLSLDDRKQNEGESAGGETVGTCVISISQVAAAVAALHERSMIEEKVRASRNSRQLSAYQRNLEHAYISKVADEERKMRPDYRPIIEHDGLLWQRSSNQETNKMKTREELLAEERDYKRRRMSYRGKKLKRSSLEVTRDIIEEYMEEIKQSGGIGSLSKEVEGTEASASDNLLKPENSTSVSGSRRNPDIYKENGAPLPDYRKKQISYYNYDDLEDDTIQHRGRESSLGHELRDVNRNGKRVRHNRDDYAESRDRGQTGSYSKGQHVREEEDSVDFYSQSSHRSKSKSHEENNREKRRYGNELNNRRRERNERDRDSHEWGRDRDSKVYRDRGRSKEESGDRKRDEEYNGHRDRRRSKTDRPDIYRPENKFEDRYDPAESQNIYEDDA